MSRSHAARRLKLLLPRPLNFASKGTKLSPATQSRSFQHSFSPTLKPILLPHKPLARTNMALARARALQTLQSSLRYGGRRAVPRVSAAGRTHLVQRRYASDGGAHGGESPDWPWALAAVAVTIPSCWYLWPDKSQADHVGAHAVYEEFVEHEHEATKEREEKEESGQEEASAEEPALAEDKQEETKESEESAKPSEGEGEGESEPPADDSDKEDFSGDKKPGSSEPANQEGENSTESEASSDEQQSSDDNKGQSKSKKLADTGKKMDTLNPTNESAAQKTKESDIARKQFGFSNAPTAHSTEPDKDPSKSKKGEGTAETAKLMDTVDPNRPAR